MPLKWKIYYACCLYTLSWITIIYAVAGFATIKDGFRDTTALAISLALLVFVIIVGKCLLSFRAISHYKNNTLQSKIEKVLFIISFGLIILVAIGIVLLSIFIIIPEDLLSRGDIYEAPRKIPLSELVLDYSFFAGGVCSIFLAIFDLILLKAIRKRYYDTLLSFGEDII